MIKYNVGCGKRNFGADWFHVDGADFPHIQLKDVFLNTTPNDTIDLLYSSHLIAYFNREEIKSLLRAWFRVIKLGGALRLATPDFKMISYLHNNGKADLSQLVGPLYGQMAMGNETIYHKTVYDYQALESLLLECGFSQVERYDHWTTEHPNTGERTDFYDDHAAAYVNGVLISLNIQCKK